MTDNYYSKRLHELDWLRVLAFGILILYHIGMYYVLDWGWHIKSPHQSQWLQDVMVLTSPWRMSLLFFISAVILTIQAQRRSSGAMFRERSRRLLWPLLFGMVVIVPPQLYVELVTQFNMPTGYTDFYASYLNPQTSLAPQKQSPIGLYTWNHLWFLPYLYIYSLILIFLMPVARKLATLGADGPLSALGFFAVVCAILGASWWKLAAQYPSSHDLVNDWFNHARYFSVMLAGVWLGLRPDLWQSIVRLRRVFAGVAVCGYLIIILDRHDIFDPYFGQYEGTWGLKFVVSTVVSLNHWGWIFAIVAYASRYLSRPSVIIGKLNRAVLPYYLFHQTAIVVLAYWLIPANLTPGVEVFIILAGVVVVCHGGYLLAEKVPVIRTLCGLQAYNSKRASIFEPGVTNSLIEERKKTVTS